MIFQKSPNHVSISSTFLTVALINLKGQYLKKHIHKYHFKSNLKKESNAARIPEFQLCMNFSQKMPKNVTLYNDAYYVVKTQKHCILLCKKSTKPK